MAPWSPTRSCTLDAEGQALAPSVSQSPFFPSSPSVLSRVVSSVFGTVVVCLATFCWLVLAVVFKSLARALRICYVARWRRAAPRQLRNAFTAVGDERLRRRDLVWESCSHCAAFRWELLHPEVVAHRFRDVIETHPFRSRVYMPKVFLGARLEGLQLNVKFLLVLRVYDDTLGDRLPALSTLRCRGAAKRHPSRCSCSRRRPRGRHLLAASSTALCVAERASARNRSQLDECPSGTPPLRTAASKCDSLASARPVRLDDRWCDRFYARIVKSVYWQGLSNDVGGAPAERRRVHGKGVGGS